MSKSTTPAQCSNADGNLARDYGLMAAEPGTNAWDKALGRFHRRPAAATIPFSRRAAMSATPPTAEGEK